MKPLYKLIQCLLCDLILLWIIPGTFWKTLLLFALASALCINNLSNRLQRFSVFLGQFIRNGKASIGRNVF